MISKLTLVGGHTAKVAVRRMLQSGLINSLACQFNWAGKGHKEPFKDAVLTDLPGTTHMSYEGTVKKWLKYAPEREGVVGRQRRAQDQAPVQQHLD